MDTAAVGGIFDISNLDRLGHSEVGGGEGRGKEERREESPCLSCVCSWWLLVLCDAQTEQQSRSLLLFSPVDAERSDVTEHTRYRGITEQDLERSWREEKGRP